MSDRHRLPVDVTENRQLTPEEIGVVRHLGVHCGAGGQVILRPWQREPAAGLWRLGLVEIWHRTMPGLGTTGPFYGLTDRGRRLAAALYTRPQRWRVKSSPASDPKPAAPIGAAQTKEKSNESS